MTRPFQPTFSEALIIRGLELEPEHLPQLIVDEHDPDIILRVHRILRVELNENPMQDLILQGVTSHERLHNVGIAYHNEITRSQSAST